MDRNAKCVRQTQHPEVMEMIDLWVTRAMEDGIDLTGEVLHQKWIAFMNLASIPDDKQLHLSDGWCEENWYFSLAFDQSYLIFLLHKYDYSYWLIPLMSDTTPVYVL